MNHSRPQTRQIREHGQAADRPQLRLIHVRAQSAAASRTRQRARQQSVRSPDKDTASTRSQMTTARAANGPQTGRNLGFPTSAASFLNNTGREPKQAKNCPGGRIAVAISPPISFLVRIRYNPAYVLL